MLSYVNMGERWWSEAINTAVYLINRQPCAAHQKTAPIEVKFGMKPDISQFRVFGSSGSAYIDKAKRFKSDKKVFPCILLGYAENTTDYRIWNLESEKIEVTRSAKFDEEPKNPYIEIKNSDTERNGSPCGACDDLESVIMDESIPVPSDSNMEIDEDMSD